MLRETMPPFPTDRRAVFEIAGGESDGAVFDSGDADPAAGATVGHLWFVTGGGAVGRAFGGRSVAALERSSRSAAGRADEPYSHDEGRRYVVGGRTDDGRTIRILLHDVTRPLSERGLPLAP